MLVDDEGLDIVEHKYQQLHMDKHIDDELEGKVVVNDKMLPLAEADEVDDIIYHIIDETEQIEWLY